MRPILPLFILVFVANTLSAQKFVYTLTADSVKITNCDSAELIIENHTQGVPGFLFNTGNGRTIFKRVLQKINDTLYLVGNDSLKIPVPKAWLQGGNSFGTTGKFGTLDTNHVDFYTGNIFRARLNNKGNFLVGTNVDNGFKLDVNGSGRFYAPTASTSLYVVGDDEYGIRVMPNYNNIYGPGSDASMITFGSVITSIGVNKKAVGNIPINSMILGVYSQAQVTTLVDYALNPAIVVSGGGALTINGGYNGISTGGTVGTAANAGAFDFNIYGGRGTGNATVGDIIFSTGNSQASGSTIHTMTNRWWLKGGTGYLSNSASPSSSIDITGANGYSQLRLRTSYTPTSSADANGNTGDFSWDSNYLYIKTSGGWKRAALTTF